MLCSSVRTVPVVFAKIQPSFKRQRDELLAIADRFEPRMRNSFIKAVNEIRSGTKLRQLAEAIAFGSEQDVFDILGLDDMQAALGKLTDEINQAYTQAGVLATTRAAEGVAGTKIFARFDAMNPRSAEFISRYNFRTVAGLAEDSKKAVRLELQTVLSEGRPPIIAARRIRDAVGLAEKDQRALNNFRTMLRNKDRTAMTRNVGGNAERSINAAIRDDTMSAEKIDRLVDGYRNRLLATRAQTIAQTEAQRAVSSGNAQAWEQIFEQNDIPKQSVRRYWVATNDERTRPDHLAIPEINDQGVAIDEPFELPDGSTIMMPHDPDAPLEQTINCRCTVVYRFEENPELEAALPPVVAGRSILPNPEYLEE